MNTFYIRRKLICHKIILTFPLFLFKKNNKSRLNRRESRIKTSLANVISGKSLLRIGTLKSGVPVSPVPVSGTFLGSYIDYCRLVTPANRYSSQKIIKISGIVNQIQ